MLFMIGIGLNDEKDITVKGLEAVKESKFIYLENYTSKLQVSVEDLEKFYGKKITLANRSFVEDGNEITNNAKESDVAFLVIGDVFGATTHIGLLQSAKENNIKVEIINNVSVLNAVGVTGLELYKFGRVASIPFHNENVEAPYIVLKQNKSIDLHTLFLLDLKPEENKFLSIKNAIEFLLKTEDSKKSGVFSEDTLCVGCARLGSKDFKIKFGTAKEILEENFGEPPFCFIVPGNLHFVEEEALKSW